MKNTLGVLAPLEGLSFAAHLDRFFVKNAEGNYDRVRWHQVGCSHLAYFDDEEQTWKAVPGREAELEALIAAAREKEECCAQG